MMYPFMTLDDNTEIVHSEMLPDARVKVYIEKPDAKDCFHSAVCYLPGLHMGADRRLFAGRDRTLPEILGIDGTSWRLLKREAKKWWPNGKTSLAKSGISAETGAILTLLPMHPKNALRLR